MPASAMISASPIFWQVMPLAPAATCIFAIIGLLCVLMCGRLATPAVSQASWIRAMLRSTRSMSITAQGVPYSRAILAARGVVMVILFSTRRMGRAQRNPSILQLFMMGIAALYPSYAHACSISSRSISSSSQRSSAADNSSCALAIAAEVSSNFLRSLV